MLRSCIVLSTVLNAQPCGLLPRSCTTAAPRGSLTTAPCTCSHAVVSWFCTARFAPRLLAWPCAPVCVGVPWYVLYMSQCSEFVNRQFEYWCTPPSHRTILTVPPFRATVFFFLRVLSPSKNQVNVLRARWGEEREREKKKTHRTELEYLGAGTAIAEWMRGKGIDQLQPAHFAAKQANWDAYDSTDQTVSGMRILRCAIQEDFPTKSYKIVSQHVLLSTGHPPHVQTRG